MKSGGRERHFRLDSGAMAQCDLLLTVPIRYIRTYLLTYCTNITILSSNQFTCLFGHCCWIQIRISFTWYHRQDLVDLQYMSHDRIEHNTLRTKQWVNYKEICRHGTTGYRNYLHNSYRSSTLKFPNLVFQWKSNIKTQHATSNQRHLTERWECKITNHFNNSFLSTLQTTAVIGN